MGKAHDSICGELQEFISDQQVFFVASAPLSAEGHVNVSPKGMDCFRVLSPKQVAYLDLTGSGNETSAHLLENGRITFMFCSFQGPPLILRLYGSGRTILPGSPEWPSLISQFPSYPGIRQIIVAEITRVQTSCGFAVPSFKYVGEQDKLTRWAEGKGETALVVHRTSSDG